MASSSSPSSSRRFFGEEWTLLSTRIPVGGLYRCAYASLDDDRHFLLGGRDRALGSVAVVEYNSLLQNFHKHRRLPERRMNAAAIAMDDDRLLVVGGYTMKTTDCCRVYDTKSRKWWTDWPPLNIRRDSHECVVNNNKVYVLGGWNFTDGLLDSIEELDLLLPTPSWRVLPQRLEKKQTGCRAIAHPTIPHSIIVTGGSNGNDNYLCCCEMICLDPAQEGQTRALPSMTTPREDHALVLVENRFVVAMGGVSTGYQSISSVEYLDLEEEQQQWRPLPSMETARAHFAGFYSPQSHKIVVAGGVDDDFVALDTVEEFPVLFRGDAPMRDVESE